jgi:hypothetical protein
VSGITRGDIVLMAGLVAAGIALVSLNPSDAGVGRTALIKSLGRETFSVNLDRSRRIAVEGPLGTTTIEVGEGTVSIVESPCPHQLCIRKGGISHTGDWVACIPNGVVVSVGITP